MKCPRCKEEVASSAAECPVCRYILVSNSDKAHQAHLPCPTCGNSYSWGQVNAQGMSYRDNDDSLLQKVFAGGSNLPARVCNTGGNIQLFLDTPASEL
jgi:hypothetical protein